MGEASRGPSFLNTDRFRATTGRFLLADLTDFLPRFCMYNPYLPRGHCASFPSNCTHKKSSECSSSMSQSLRVGIPEFLPVPNTIAVMRRQSVPISNYAYSGVRNSPRNDGSAPTGKPAPRLLPGHFGEPHHTSPSHSMFQSARKEQCQPRSGRCELERTP